MLKISFETRSIWSTGGLARCYMMCLMIFILLAPGALFAKPGVELMPVAVWQGKPTRPWSVGILRDIRAKFPNVKLAHAVSPAPMVRAGEQDLGFRQRFSKIIQPGDDILLHVAPWKSVVERARLEFRNQPTVFGAPVNLDDCSFDCGLDLSVRAFSDGELKSLISFSKDTLRLHGFGEPKAVFFDEGLIGKSSRLASLGRKGIEDWSGIEISQLRRNLARFPVYTWNLEATSKMPLDSHDLSFDGPVQLDHLRFAIQAEIADMDSTTEIIKLALQTARTHQRLVRIPIVFNVEELVHTQKLVEGALGQVIQMAHDAAVPIREWKAKNATWTRDGIRRGEDPPSMITVSVSSSNEAEFISDDERLLLINTAH